MPGMEAEEKHCQAQGAGRENLFRPVGQVSRDAAERRLPLARISISGRRLSITPASLSSPSRECCVSST